MGDLLVTGKVRSAQTVEADDLSVLVTRQYFESVLMNFATGGSGGNQFPENGIVTFDYATIVHTLQALTLIVNGSSTLSNTSITNLMVTSSASITGLSANTASISGALSSGSASLGATYTSTLSTSSLASLNSLQVANRSTLNTLTVSGASSLGSLTSGATLASSLSVTNATILLGTLNVSQAANFNTIGVASTSTLSALIVTGSAQFQGSTTLGTTSTGALSASSIASSGSGAFATLSSSGLATLNSAQITTTLAAASASTTGSFSVGTNAVIGGSFSAASGSISGAFSTSTISATSTATLNNLVITNKAISAATLSSDAAGTLTTLGFIQATYVPLAGGSVAGNLSVSGLLGSGSFSTGSGTASSWTVSGSSSFADASFSSIVTSSSRLVFTSASLSDPSFSAVSNGTRINLIGTNNAYAIGLATNALWISSADSIKFYTNSAVSATFDSAGALTLRGGLIATTIVTSSQATLNSVVVSGSAALNAATITSLTVSGSTILQSVQGTSASFTSGTYSSTLSVTGMATFSTGATISTVGLTIAGGNDILFTGSGSQIDFGSSGALGAPLLGGSNGTRVYLNGSTEAIGVETGYVWAGTTGGFRVYRVSASPFPLMSLESTGNVSFFGSVSGASGSFAGSMSSGSVSTGSAAVTNALSAGSLASATLALTGKGTSASTGSGDGPTTLVTKDFVLPAAGGTLSGALGGTSATFSGSVQGQAVASEGGAGSAQMSLNSVSSANSILYKLNGVNRWRLRVDGTPQNFLVESFDDTGVLTVTTPLSITRASGNVNIPNLSSASASFTSVTSTSISSSGTASFGTLSSGGTSALTTIGSNTSFTNTGTAQVGILTGTGAATFLSTVSVVGNAIFSTISSSGQATLNSVVITSAATAASLSIAGLATAGTFSTTGQASLNSLVVTNGSTFSGTISAQAVNATTMSASAAGGISTTALATSALATINSLAVTTTSTFTGLITAGQISAGKVSSSNAVFASSDLVTRAYVEANFAPLSSSLSLSGTLSVAGNASFFTLSSSGLATLNSLSVTSTTNLIGALTAASGSFTSISNSGASSLIGNATLGNAVLFSSAGTSDPVFAALGAGTRIAFTSGTNQNAIGVATGGVTWFTSPSSFTFSIVTGNTFLSVGTLSGSGATFPLGISTLSLTSSGAISGTALSGTSLAISGTSSFTNGATFNSTVLISGQLSTAAISASGKITAQATVFSDNASVVITKGYAESFFLPTTGGSISGSLSATTASFSGTLTSSLAFVSSGTATFSAGLTVSAGATSIQALQAATVSGTGLTISGSSSLYTINTSGLATLASASITGLLSGTSASFTQKVTCTATLSSSDDGTTLITKGFADARYYPATLGTLNIARTLTGPRTAAINLYGDDFYTDYSLQIARVGQNPLIVGAGNYGYTQIDHRGTGDFLIGCQEAGTIRFYTNPGTNPLMDYTRLSIDSTGIVTIANRVVITGSTASTISNLTVGTLGITTATITNLNLSSNLVFSTLGSRIDFGSDTANLAAPSTSGANAGTHVLLNGYQNAVGTEASNVWLTSVGGFKLYRNTGLGGAISTLLTVASAGNGDAVFLGSLTSQSGTSSFVSATLSTSLSVGSVLTVNSSSVAIGVGTNVTGSLAATATVSAADLSGSNSLTIGSAFSVTSSLASLGVATQLAGNLTLSASGNSITFSSGTAAPSISAATAGSKLILSSLKNAVGYETSNVWISSDGGFKVYRNTGTALTALLTLGTAGNGDMTLLGSVTSTNGTSSFASITVSNGLSVSAGSVSVPSLVVSSTGAFTGKVTSAATVVDADSGSTLITKTYSDAKYVPLALLNLSLGGTSGTGSRNPTLNWVSDDTNPFGFQIARNGSAGTTNLTHRGTGALTLATRDAGSILLATNSTTAVTIASNGNVTLANNLTVQGSGTSSFQNLNVVGSFSAGSLDFSNQSVSGILTFTGSGSLIDFQIGQAAPLAGSASSGVKVQLSGYKNAVGYETDFPWISSQGGFKVYRNDGTSVTSLMAIASTGNGDTTFLGALTSSNGQSSFPSVAITTGGLSVSGGSIASTQAWNATSAQISLGGATGNRIDWASAGYALPSFTTRSVGTKLVLWPNTSGTTVDTAIGVAGATSGTILWNSVQNASGTFAWFAATTQVLGLSGAGALTLYGNLDWASTGSRTIGAGVGSTNTLTLGASGVIVSAPGSFSTGGSLTSTQDWNAATGSGQISLNGTTGNRIEWAATGSAVPSFATRSTGTKMVLWPAVGLSSADTAVGVSGSTGKILWNSVQDVTGSFAWYAGTTQIHGVTGTGATTLYGTGANLTVQGTGTSTFSGAVTIGSTLGIAGFTTATGGLGVSNGNSLYVSAGTTIANSALISPTSIAINNAPTADQNVFLDLIGGSDGSSARFYRASGTNGDFTVSNAGSGVFRLNLSGTTRFTLSPGVSASFSDSITATNGVSISAGQSLSISNSGVSGSTANAGAGVLLFNNTASPPAGSSSISAGTKAVLYSGYELGTASSDIWLKTGATFSLYTNVASPVRFFVVGSGNTVDFGGATAIIGDGTNGTALTSLTLGTGSTVLSVRGTTQSVTLQTSGSLNNRGLIIYDNNVTYGKTGFDWTGENNQIYLSNRVMYFQDGTSGTAFQIARGGAVTFNRDIDFAAGARTLGASIGSGNVFALGAAGVIVSAPGRFTTAGSLTSTQDWNAATGSGQISLNGTTGNRIEWAATGSAVPSFATRSTGTKMVLWPAVGLSSADTAVGVSGSTGTILWNSVQDVTGSFAWYAGTAQVLGVSGAGATTLYGTGANLNVQGTGTSAFAGSISIATLTASRLMASSETKSTASVADLTVWVKGTAGQVISTSGGDGTLTLSLPQSILTTSSPTFANATLSALTASRLMASDGLKATASVADLTVWVKGTSGQVISTSGADGTLTLSLPAAIVTTGSAAFNSISSTTSITAASATINGNISGTGATFNGLTLSFKAAGFTIAGGTASKTLIVSSDSTIDQSLAQAASPTFVGMTLSGGTASRLLSLDASKNTASATLISYVAGTANRVTVSDNGSGGVTLSGPQDLASTSSPTFAAVSTTFYSLTGAGGTIRMYDRDLSGNYSEIYQSTGYTRITNVGGDAFQIGGSVINLLKNTSISGTLTTNNNNITAGTGTLTCGALTSTTIITNNNNVNAGSGTVTCGVLQASNTTIQTDRILINQNGTGDRNAFVDFYAVNATGTYNARIIRNAGTAGTLAFTNISTGAMTFATGASPVIRLTIGSDGSSTFAGAISTSNNNVNVGNGGVTFSSTGATGTTVTSNTLSDYEFGTFVPTVNGGYTPAISTYTTQLGWYHKIGRQCMINVNLAWTGQTPTPAAISFSLPFLSLSTTGYVAAGYVSQVASGFAITAGNALVLRVNNNTSTTFLYQVGGATVTSTNVSGPAAGTISFTLTYMTNT